MHEISILAFIANVNALLQVKLLRRTLSKEKKKKEMEFTCAENKESYGSVHWIIDRL